ncbi:MAG TPA: hypothetical protein VGG90_11170 [Candidatus Dormibacteraeota bacterium]|jgi:hypothetical protein
MSGWTSLDKRWKTFVIVAAVVVVASIAYALNIRFVLIGAKGVTAVDDFGEAAAAAIASAACAWAAYRATGRNRLGWALLGISAGLWSAGEIVWSVYEVILGVPTPYPSFADVGFLAAVPFAIGGIRAFWSDARATSAGWRVWFDGLIVAIALTSTAWGFGLRTVYQSSSSTKLLDLAYPVGDILVGTVLILAIRRASGQQKGRMALLLIGIASYSISDSAFAFLTAQGAFGSVGNVIDTGWFFGFLLIALAAIYPDAPMKAASKKQAPLDLWQLALPWMTLLTASAGDLYSAFSDKGVDVFMASMTGSLAVLLTVNMILERKEFLEMLTDIEGAHTTVTQEFKAALVKIRHFSVVIRDVDRLDRDDMRRLAAEIHEDADRLDRMIEEMVAPEELVRQTAGVAVGAAVASAQVTTAGSHV